MFHLAARRGVRSVQRERSEGEGKGREGNDARRPRRKRKNEGGLRIDRESKVMNVKVIVLLSHQKRRANLSGTVRRRVRFSTLGRRRRSGEKDETPRGGRKENARDRPMEEEGET